MDSNDVQVIPARDETSSGRIGEFLEQSLSAANLNLVRVLAPWICDVLLSDRSIEAYGTDLVQFAQYLEKNDVSLQNATADHVRLYKASLLRSGARTGTVARKLSVLRGAYRVFADKGIVSWPTANAIASIKSPPVNKNSTPALSAEQAGALLKAIPGDTIQGIRDLALIQTFFITGCRVSAICRLRVGDLEFDGADYYVNVREKRGRESRKVLLVAATSVRKYIAAAQIESEKTRPLFRPLSHCGSALINRPMHRSTPLRLVKKYCRIAGIDPTRLTGRGICVHSLRKTAITDAIRNGATIHEAREFADHADIRSTDLYFQRREEDAEKAARCIQLL